MAQDPDTTAARYIDSKASFAEIRRRASSCTACDLYKRATQTVFGEGPRRAAVMLVGEQPGDAEDREGRPFVGPAGRLLDKALAEAGIERDQTYVTNVVKHFRWVARGKRRLHQKPKYIQIRACLPWLSAEIERIAPEVVICLGATAAQAVYGRSFRVTKQRGRPIDSPVAPHAFATVHPSSLLRHVDPETRRREYEQFVADLQQAAASLTGKAKA